MTESHCCVLPWWLSGKEPASSAGDAGDMGLIRGSIPGSRGSPREGNGNLLWYPCLENPTDRVAS